MPRQYFSINKEIFDIDFTSKSGAYDLQNRISSLVNGPLTRQMEQLMEEKIPENFLYKINTLTVDVGTVNLNNLEQELPQKFMQAFKDILEEHISLQHSGMGGDNFQVLPVEASLEDLIAYFLLTGHLPWWAMQNESYTPTFVLSEMLLKNPAALRAIIIKAGQHEHVRKRLVKQFSKDQVQAIIRLLEPGEAEYIFAFEEHVLEVKQNQNTIQAEQKEFEKAVSYFILTYLIAERGGAFNKKEFAKSVLAQIAFNFNMQYITLLHIFYNVVENLENKGFDYAFSLKLLIRELAFEEYDNTDWGKINTEAPKKIITADNLVDDLKMVRQYLISGTLPFTISGKPVDANTMRKILFRLISIVPDTFQLLLAQVSWNKLVADRLFALLGTVETKQYTKILYGHRADVYMNIAATFSLLHKTKKTWVVDDKIFEEIVWKSVLAATLVAPVHLIDDRQLVHLILKGISSALRVSVAIVAQRIHTGIKTLFNIDHMQMPHLDMIHDVVTGIQFGNEISLLVNKTELNKDQQITDSLFGTEAQMLSHLLRFLLQYGTLPWWGRSYAGKSPFTFFQQLNQLSIVEMQLVFRFAGSTAQLRQRWLQMLGKESFMTALRSFEHSATIIQLLQEQDDLAEVITTAIQYNKPDSVKMDMIARNLVWQVFHQGRYQFFSVQEFYSKIFIAQIHFFKVQPFQLVAEWKKWYGLTYQAADPIKLVLDALDKLYPWQQNAIPLTRVSENDKQSAAWAQVFTDAGYEFSQQYNISANTSLAELLQMPDSFSKEKLTVYLLSVLKSYLIKGELPASLTGAGDHDKNIFFRLLLQFIYVANPFGLIKILSLPDANSFRVLEITTQYQISEGGYAKDIALLMLPVKNKLKSLTRLQSAEDIKIVGKKEQEIFVDDILMAFTAKQDIEPGTNRAKLIYELLSYYLTWNKLPDTLLKTVSVSVHTIVLHLIRHLFAIDQALVNQLLSARDHLPEALMSVYAIIAAGHTAEDKKLLAMMSANNIGAFAKDIPFGLATSTIAPIDAVASLSGDILSGKKEFLTVIEAGTLKAYLKNRNDRVVYLATSDELYNKAILVYKNDLPGFFEEDSNYVEKMIQSAFTDTLLRERILILFRYFSLQSAIQGLLFRNSEDYFYQLLQYLALSYPQSTSVLEQLYSQVRKQSDDRGIKLQLLLAQQVTMGKEAESAAEVFNKFYDDRDISLTSRDQLAEQQKIIESLEREIKRAKEKERSEEAEEARAKQQEKNVKLYIPNAGLVILHPFLATYFTRLGLMDNNIFLSNEAKERAVLILQYLATGRTKFDEYELILNKILCGLPIEQPVANEIELTDYETALTDELFDVLKQRWEKVKNSSVESIRASFIQREGALELLEDQWNLRVEQRGYDLLLQTLPWAFGFIKTSWMNQILTVEWI